MKKVLLTIIILSIAVTSVFGLVACDPKDLSKVNTLITDPNEFIKQFKETTEFTLYAYDDKGNEIGKISRNGNGEFMFIEGVEEAYVIKENNIFILYTKTAGEWTKETDESLIEEMRNSFALSELVEQLDEVGTLVKNDDGFWYGATDIEKNSGFKMEDGMFVGYIKTNETWLKSSALELKSDIRLPEEAKNAGECTQISDPNEFVKQLKTATDFTIYGYDEKGNVGLKISKNSEGEIAITMAGAGEKYLIKENDVFVLYTKSIDGQWDKTTDSTAINELKNDTNIQQNGWEMIEMYGPFIKNDDGYWYFKVDIEKKMPCKMEKGVLVCYFANNNTVVKVSTAELKADIELPEEAKNAGGSTQISDPNEFFKLLKDSKELTEYTYDLDGNLDMKISINSEGEIEYIDNGKNGIEEKYLIKENDVFVLYTKSIDGQWNKTTDSTAINELKNFMNIQDILESMETQGPFIKNDNGYWYLKVDIEKKIGFKMEKGMLVGYYTINNTTLVKVAELELKADVKLPEEAKKQ